MCSELISALLPVYAYVTAASGAFVARHARFTCAHCLLCAYAVAHYFRELCATLHSVPVLVRYRAFDYNARFNIVCLKTGLLPVYVCANYRRPHSHAVSCVSVCVCVCQLSQASQSSSQCCVMCVYVCAYAPLAGLTVTDANVLAGRMRRLRLAECLSGISLVEYPVFSDGGGIGDYNRVYMIKLKFFR